MTQFQAARRGEITRLQEPPIVIVPASYQKSYARDDIPRLGMLTFCRATLSSSPTCTSLLPPDLKLSPHKEPNE